MKGETIAVNVLAPLKEFYQQLNASVTSVLLDISNYKKSVLLMVQVSCLIHGFKVKCLEMHSVKGKTLDIFVNSIINWIINSIMIKLFGLANIKNMLWWNITNF